MLIMEDARNPYRITPLRARLGTRASPRRAFENDAAKRHLLAAYYFFGV